MSNPLYWGALAGLIAGIWLTLAALNLQAQWELRDPVVNLGESAWLMR